MDHKLRPYGPKGTTAYLVAAVIISLISVALIYVFVTVYVLYDDCAMRTIASGEMTGVPDGHIMFINYITGVILAGLYSLTGSVGWLDLLYMFCLFISICAFIYRVLSLTEGMKSTARACVAVFSVLLFVFMFFPFIGRLSYTTTASMLGMTVIFHYALTDRLAAGDTALIAFMSILCFAIRYESFLMLAPYILIVIIYKISVSPDKKDFFKNQLPLWIIIIAGIGILYAADRNAYRGEYEAVRQINEYRSVIQDKGGAPSYEANRSMYEGLGISEDEYYLLSLNWGLTEHFNSETLKTLAYVTELNATGKGEIFKRLTDSLLGNIGVCSGVVFILISIWTVISAVRRKRIADIAVIAAAFITALLECIYILAIGRELDYRLAYSFVLAVVICLTACGYRMYTDDPLSQRDDVVIVSDEGFDMDRLTAYLAQCGYEVEAHDEGRVFDDIEAHLWRIRED